MSSQTQTGPINHVSPGTPELQYGETFFEVLADRYLSRALALFAVPYDKSTSGGLAKKDCTTDNYCQRFGALLIFPNYVAVPP